MNAQLAQINSLPVQTSWGEEQKTLIKQTVAKDATDAELDWFLQVCNARNLNPFLKQIWFIKRGGTPCIQTSIDGLRAIANRTGKLEGIRRGTKKVGEMLYAWAEVRRKDWAYPAYEEVSFKEYNAGSALWNRMPETMLKKCAEAAALRMAFPEDLSGMYSDEEMEQANLQVGEPENDKYLRHVGATYLNTPEQQDSYSQDRKDCRDRIVAKREELNLSREQLEMLMGKKLTLRLSLTEILETEKWLEDLETRIGLNSLTPEEEMIIYPQPEPEETINIEVEDIPY